MLAKRPRYYFDADAIREPHEMTPQRRNVSPVGARGDDYSGQRGHRGMRDMLADEPTTFGHPAGRNKRSVWTVATQPFSSERLGLGETEHFAVFPSKLVEPCVLAGSAARACGVCGAPWRRVVEREGESTRARLAERGASAYANGQPRNAQGLDYAGGHGANLRASRTVGWEPSCAHNDDTGRSVVLDPFAGSGTVGVVAGWHGRDFIGIELNDSYARMARERIALEGRPGGRPAHHEPARANGHPSLFDLGGDAA
jgi:hypothetical protein